MPYWSFRKIVLRRYNYKCQCCGRRSRRRNTVHHILELSLFPGFKQRFSNCIVLCKECHRSLHSLWYFIKIDANLGVYTPPLKSIIRVSHLTHSPSHYNHCKSHRCYYWCNWCEQHTWYSVYRWSVLYSMYTWCGLYKQHNCYNQYTRCNHYNQDIQYNHYNTNTYKIQWVLAGDTTSCMPFL